VVHKFILFFICLTAICSPSCSAQEQDYPVVMFWNLENFFNPYDDPKKDDDDFTPQGDYHWTWKRWEVKKNAIAKTILAVKESGRDYPFLVGVCEVEDKVVVRKLTQESNLYKLGYSFIHRESPDVRGIDVALLYRKEEFIPSETRTLRVSMPQGKKTRDILYVKGVETATRDTLHVFTLHWPSKGGGEEETLPGRISAARTLTKVTDSILTVLPSARIIVMGDFNDTPGSKPLLAATDSGLTDLAIPLAKAGKGTLRYQGNWEIIDHFLVSAPFSGLKMKIFSPDFLLEEDTKYLGSKPFRTYYGPRYNGGVSDHLPILLELNQ